MAQNLAGPSGLIPNNTTSGGEITRRLSLIIDGPWAVNMIYLSGMYMGN